MLYCIGWEVFCESANPHFLGLFSVSTIFGEFYGKYRNRIFSVNSQKSGKTKIKNEIKSKKRRFTRDFLEERKFQLD